MGHVIELDDSDIIEETYVDIIEERYIEGSLLKLTKEQINIELTNLLYETYKNDVLSKVNTFTKLFFDTSREESNDYYKRWNLFPIVRFIKIEHYDDESFNVDPEYEKTNEVKYTQLQTFLNQFYILSKSRNNYDTGVQKIGSLFTPFIPTGDTEKVLNNTDAYRSLDGDIVKPQTWRLIEDDNINVIGYISKAINNKSLSEGIKDLHTFDWSIYIKEIKALKAGDKVKIAFNDFSKSGITTMTNTMNTTIPGVIDRVIKGVLYIKFKEETIKYDTVDLPTFCYVFKEKSTNVFTRFDLFEKDIYFVNCDVSTIKTYIHPSTFNEVLFLLSQYVEVKNFDDINVMLSSYGKSIHPSSINKTSAPILRQLFEKRYPPLKIAKREATKTYNHYFPHFLNLGREVSKGFNDTDVHRFKHLHSSINNEKVLILSLLHKYLEKKFVNVDQIVELRNSLSRQLDNTGNNQEEDECDKPNNIVISKVYTTLDDLKADNGKTIYFDESLDQTEYKVKLLYDSDMRIREYLVKKGLSNKDLEFEFKTIKNGKRKVRVGDSCLLSTVTGDSIYKMMSINNETIWVKQSSLPFKVCIDDLLASKIIKDADCVFDTYANLCKNLRSVKANIKYNKLKLKIDILESIIDFHKNHTVIIDSIKDDIGFHSNMENIIDHISLEPIKINKQPSVDLEDYFENGETFEYGESLSFADTQHYAILNNDIYSKKEGPVITGASLEFIDMLVGFMDLEIKDFDKKYLVDFVNSQVGMYDVDAKLQKERKKLEKQIVRALYETNKEYRDKIDDTINKKLEVVQKKELTDMYYSITKYGIAMLSLIIMSNYPDMLIKNIYPSCVRFMTYQGYPINERNSTRSLSQYMCCLVKAITSGSDTKFDKIQSESIEKLNEEVLKTIDKILKDNVNLRLRVEANQGILKERKLKEDTKKYKEFNGFRPNFDTHMSNASKIAKVLNELNNVVKESKHLRVGITKVPYLFNSCCLEKLTGTLTYYDLFQKSNVYKQLIKNLKISSKPRNHILKPSILLKKNIDGIREGDSPIEFDNAVTVTSRYEKKSALCAVEKISKYISNNLLFNNDPILMNVQDKYNSESFWDEDIYMKIMEMYNGISTVMKNSKYNPELLSSFKNTIIMMKDVSNSSSITYTLYNFVRSILPRVFAIIINGKVLDNESKDKPNNIYINFANNDKFNKKIIKTIYDIALKDTTLIYFEKDSIKNITFLNYVITKILYNIIVSTIHNKPTITHEVDMSLLLTVNMSSNEVTKNNIAMACDFAYFIIESLLKSVSINDLNINNINKKIELLREEKKQSLIDKYRRDDESRQTQMQLRKFGDKSWEAVDEASERDIYVDMLDYHEVDITKYRNQREEDENYKLNDVGENPDNDEEDI